MYSNADVRSAKGEQMASRIDTPAKLATGLTVSSSGTTMLRIVAPQLWR